MKYFALIALVSIFLTGCPSQPTKEGSAGAQQQTSNQQDSTQTGDGAQTSKIDGSDATNSTALSSQQDDPYRKDAINDPNSPLSQKVIYFDFDLSKVKEEYQDLVTWHGRYLASNPDMKMRLEGHTDERGTREYNIALGERRSQAVKRLMLFQGATEGQLEVISYGEEKPVALEHAEDAWSQNRRVELVYEAK